MTVEFGISDDYAVLKLSEYKFYYGYEYTIPEYDPENEDRECQWAFVVWQRDKEVTRRTLNDIKNRLDSYYASKLDHAMPLHVLIAGIGIFLEDRGFLKHLSPFARAVQRANEE